MKIAAYVFDWSGVVSDDRMPVYTANMMLFDHFGLPRITFEQWQERSTLTAAEILKNHGANADPDTIRNMYREFYAEVVKGGMRPSVYPDAVEMLKAMATRALKLAVMSSHPEEHLLDEAAQYGVKGMFAHIMGSVTDKAKMLADMPQIMDVPLEDMFYVGDTIYDAEAAEAVGMKFVARIGGYHSEGRLLGKKHALAVRNLAELAEPIE
jgi:phosphoglycolate phosphatase-like HAD superfamily hydrolase